MDKFDPVIFDITFDEVCNILWNCQQHHRDSKTGKIASNGEELVNRLFKKHMEDKFKKLVKKLINLPILTKINTIVTLEYRLKSNIWKIVPLKSNNPRSYSREYPIIIVKYLNKEYLIDGGTRCNEWRINNVKDNHPILIIEYI